MPIDPMIVSIFKTIWPILPVKKYLFYAKRQRKQKTQAAEVIDINLTLRIIH